jgi:HAD superfamily hydrolase (TIGR01509 family)
VGKAITDRLPPGKVPWDLVADTLRFELPPEVVLGPAVGEDAAIVEIGGELWAVATDPISFTAADAGRLAVEVNANDVAVRGARPTFFLAVVLISPGEATRERAREILGQIQTTCSRLGVTVIGGHTEVAPGLPHSMVVGTMLGPVVDRPLTTGGLRAGDWIGMTRSAGLEGSSILIAEFGPRLRELHGERAVRACEEIREAGRLSVVAEALGAAAVPAVSALHDVTEGGVGEALHEMSRASGLAIELHRENVPVLDGTSFICSELGIDPLGLIGSGSLLVGCSAEGRSELETALADEGVSLAWIGRAAGAGSDRGSELPRFPTDEILKAFAVRGLEAVLFDMDGTLVDTEYDWPAIRRRLGVEGRSIIDDLNGLPQPERDRRWADLEATERAATEAATLKDGVPELLREIRARGLATALVTNNSELNTRWLLERFGLDFEVVVTRDTGMWKPSGAPLEAAARRLGVEVGRCLAVGDSSYDVEAAREAGCGAVCVLFEGARRHRDGADLALADVPALIRYLRVVI